MQGIGIFKPNPREPWMWPAARQIFCWALAIVFGVLLIAPWWLNAWEAWRDAQQAAQKMAHLQAEVHHAQQRHQQLAQALAQRQVETAMLLPAMSNGLPKLSQALTHLAERENLAMSSVDWSQALPVSSLKASALQQVPVHVQLQGAWPAWMRWWSQLHQVAPMATVSHLAFKSQPSGGWVAQVALHIPQQGALSNTHNGDDRQLAGATLPWASEAANDDPVDARAWAQTQTQHAQQHPSYARWIAPELQRPRVHLETLPLERLRYVGRISQDGLHQALLRWTETTGAASHAPIFTVAVGDYVGQDFGRVQKIAADQLTLRELVRNAQGVWQPRDARLPLEAGAK